MGDKDKNPTAEQQLLGLIEGNDKLAELKGATLGQLGAAPIDKRHVPMFSADVLKGRLGFFLESLKNYQRTGDIDVVLTIVNNSLIAAICGLFVFLGYEIMVKPDDFKSLPELIASGRGKAADIFTPAPPADMEYYISKIKNRDIFKAKPKEVEKAPEAVALAPVSAIDQALPDLKLVGISPSENPDDSMVMIEDKKTQSTQFLKAGDTIMNVTIKEILFDRVILTDGKEDRELR